MRHMVFKRHIKQSKNNRYSYKSIEEEDESDFGDTGLNDDLREKKEINRKYIASLMKRIGDEEMQDTKLKLPSQRIKNLSLGLDSIKGVRPIEFLKDLEIRKQV